MLEAQSPSNAGPLPSKQASAQSGTPRRRSQRSLIASSTEACFDWQGQKVFVDVFGPAPRLVIVGAIDIAESLAAFACSIGWRTVCVDPRAAFATPAHVPSVHELRIEWPHEALKTLELDEEAAVVVLLRDEKFIVPALDAAPGELAVRDGQRGGFLRGGTGAIHERREDDELDAVARVQLHQDPRDVRFRHDGGEV